MPLQLNSPGWKIRTSAGDPAWGAGGLPGLPAEFLTAESVVAEEAILQPPRAVRGAAATAGGALDLSCGIDPGHTAVLAIRHASGALTFSLPIESTSRGVRGATQVRFRVPVRQTATRGLVAQAVKAIVIRITKVAADKAATLVLPRLAAALVKEWW